MMSKAETLKRLQAASFWMRALCYAVVGVLAGTAVFIILTAGLKTVKRFAQNYPGVIADPDLVTMPAIILVTLLGLVTVAIAAAAFLALARMFDQFAKGRLLDGEASQQLRLAGILFCASALWSTLAHTLNVLVLSSFNPPGERQLAVSVSFDQVFPLVLAGVLYAVGHVLSLAIALDRETKEFV